MKRFADYFDSLSGKWSLKRTISSGEELTGELIFKPAGDDALFASEAGTLRLGNGNLVSASRRWLWRYEFGILKIFFVEEPLRLYHEFVPEFGNGNWHGNSHHSCDPDVYLGEYVFSPGRISSEQIVSGPRKDLRIITECERLEPNQTS
ncbi:MAG: DUF6314 family protein [Pseudomonadota bacterium]